ncbi:type II toxin-antitoxin system HicB family antitoxin [Vibrio sp. SCSIO 43137]|uniref:type II toxin-antitoxin system HicB family antitoxin n=1 Tax=Vibrio sp. SCSIO 43137 TaxID=3021011 RepID=UPI00230816E1|nr:type II toxin-antitoxin system HicB family antitoxin [Vibrio sp. SCSIO 43137]WCE31847.1 type II toxin-antitoxin system HicB family antitoxin [Vibrio sp. SCSIO 43137]
MLYPIAIETGNDEYAYGVVIPDLPGCFAAGDTLEEALANAKDAANFYLEYLAERQQLPPQAGSLADWQKSEEFTGWAWAVVEVDVEPYMGKSKKYNVSLPTLLRKKIDDTVTESSDYAGFSQFIQQAAIKELERMDKESE